MTTYLASYDTEAPGCLAGVRTIVEMHEKYEMPATFFLVAQTVDDDEAEYVALLKDHPLFEIACHTYTHMVVRDTPRFGKAGPLERFPREIIESKERLEDVFACEIIGFRPPVSAVDGLQNAPDALQHVDQAGYQYVSSLAWGPDWSLPALLNDPLTYADQGYPAIWEIPPCGWHDNLLKGNNKCGPVRLCLFPSPMPEAVPTDYIETADDEFRVNNKPFLDKACEENRAHVSLIWHPWSLHRFDPEMRMLDLTFAYVRELGLPAATFADFYRSLASAN
jgi:polysaccharide deacetylase